MRRAVIAIFAVVVAAILFLVLCTFVRRPYERVLLNRFGSVVDEPQQTRLAYNWYFKWPTDSVIRIDTRLEMYTSPLQEVVTAGSESISVRTYAAWKVVDAVKFYRTTGASDVKAKQIMGQKISGLVQSKLANHRLDEIFNMDESKVHTQEIESEVAKEVSYGSPDPTTPGGFTAGIQDQGLEIVQIGFSRMAFPPANALFVYQRMSAERNEEAQKYKSEGDSQAMALKQQGDTEATKIRSEAVKQSEEIRGQGDRQALEILAAVQQSPSARDFYQYWKSMEFVKTSLAKNTIFVLPTDTDWLKSLFVAPVNVGGGATTQPAK
jgi:membrane protease subunit HflC